MLAETQGIRAPLTELRERYPASQHGTSLATLCAILGGWRCRLIRWRSNIGIWRRCLYRPFCITARATMCCWRIAVGVRMRNESGIGAATVAVRALKAEISGYALVLDRDEIPAGAPARALPPARFRQFKPEGHRRHRRHLFARRR